MPITKFQALVARESMGDVFASAPHLPEREGDVATVIKIHENRTGTWVVLVEFADTSRTYLQPAHVDPGRDILTLIENGTYNEETMTWTSRMGDGRKLTQPLYYGDNPNYQGKMNGEQYC